MAAVAAGSAAVRRTVARRRQDVSRSGHSLRRRSISGARGLLRAAATVFGLALLFAYVNLYANLAATSATRANLQRECRIERIQNERLRLALNRASVAPNIADRAEAAGMVYANRYDYLTGPRNVARAETE